ncbi:Metal-binding protein [Mannheimia sp. USDA-ARS-USMARC-1261]|nr:Metal-binding protein [Mannheimia sp. USDA-ARS-USMARC-1261]
MPFDGVAVNHGGVAGAVFGRYAHLCADLAVAGVVDFHAKTVVLHMLDPFAAAAATWAFVHFQYGFGLCGGGVGEHPAYACHACQDG